MNHPPYLDFGRPSPPSSPQGHGRHRSKTAPELPTRYESDHPPLPPRPPLPPALIPGASRPPHAQAWSDLSFQSPHREWSLPEPIWSPHVDVPPPRPPPPVPPKPVMVPANPESSLSPPPMPARPLFLESSSSSRSESPRRPQGRSPISNSPIEPPLSSSSSGDYPPPSRPQSSPPTMIAPMPQFIAGSSKEPPSPRPPSTCSSVSLSDTSLPSPTDKYIEEALRRSLLPETSPVKTTVDEDVRLAMALSSLDDEEAMAESRRRAERERLDMEYAQRLQQELENAPPTPADTPSMTAISNEAIKSATSPQTATSLPHSSPFSPVSNGPSAMPPSYEQAVTPHGDPLKVIPQGGSSASFPIIKGPFPAGPSRPPFAIKLAESDPGSSSLRRAISSDAVDVSVQPHKHPHMVRSQTAAPRPTTSSGVSIPQVPRLPPHINTSGIDLGSSKGAMPTAPRPQSRDGAVGGAVWRTSRMDPELLKGVSFGFMPPPTISDLQPMMGVIPDVIHLPAAPSPPFHLQARSWRSLLRLLARLDSTRLEASVEALATLKEEARLRTVIQFNKIDYSHSDWRVVIYLTLDHALPPSARGVYKYTNGDTTTLPYSYTLCKPPVRLQSGDSSQFFNVPQTTTSPFPTLPLGISNLAMYLQSVLEDSRKALGDTSGGSRRLAKMVEQYYPDEMRGTGTEEDGSREGAMKRLFGGWRKKERVGRGGNEETFDLVTPFRLDEYQ